MPVPAMLRRAIPRRGDRLRRGARAFRAALLLAAALLAFSGPVRAGAG